MKILTYGNKEKEKVLLLHPMFTSEKFFDFAIDTLIKNYYLIIPTYSGHYQGSDFISMEEEIKTIDNFLSENGINNLKAVIGFSLGGNIAFNYFILHKDIIDQVIVDSAPIFKFPKFFNYCCYKRYKKCLERVRKSPQNAAKELNKCFNGMGEAQQYVAPIVTDKSLKGLVKTCFNVNTPKIDSEAQKKMTFVYGTKDIAKFCKPRIIKYKNSRLVKIKSSGHCGYFRENLDEYMKLINTK